jgi:hypothetical protein
MGEVAGRTLRRWALAGAVYNFLLGLPLMFPVIFEQNYAMTNGLNRALGLGGQDIVPPGEAVNKLFANTSALLLVAVGVLLIYASRDLRNRAGIVVVNAASRIVSSLLIIYYVLAEDLARIYLLIVLADLVFATAFLYYVSKLRGSSLSSGISANF